MTGHSALSTRPSQLPRGYKQTEVGVIPEDWEVRPLASLQPVVTSGSRGWAEFYSDRGDSFIRITNLSRNSIELDLTDLRFVTLAQQASEANRTKVQIGDVLISITADIGIVGYISEKVPRPAYINQHIALVRFDQSKVVPKFISYFLSSSRSQKLFRAFTDAGAKAGMNLATVQQIRTALPPTLAEQEAIAEALSDADALIESLEQLIAKKRLIKQGAMQELLTGKRRLPGFSGEWEVGSMQVLGQTYGGLTGKTKKDFEHGNARYIPFLNVLSNTTIDPSWIEPVEVAPSEMQNHVRRGDLFFNGSSETPTDVGLCSILQHDIADLFLNSFCFAFRLFPAAQADGLFLVYWFRSMGGRKAMSLMAQGATRYNIAKSAFMRLRVPLPEKTEQTAIASILSDMDAEIVALEERLEKARLIKQGMMQELLTGKRRLIARGAAEKAERNR